MSIYWNLFHILCVATFLCVLAYHLAPDAVMLRKFTFAVAFLVVVFHSYKAILKSQKSKVTFQL
jgi:hypothetical protein